MIRITTAALIAAATFGIAISAAPTFADTVSNNDVPQFQVKLTGMDLSSPEAVKKLQAIIRRNAAEACYQYEEGNMVRSTEARDCFTHAVANGNAQIEGLHVAALARHNNETVVAQAR